jgi:hypothetical protein
VTTAERIRIRDQIDRDIARRVTFAHLCDGLSWGIWCPT